MKVLVLTPEVPITSQMPGSPRLYRFCQALSLNHSLTLFYLQKSEDLQRWFVSDSDAVGIFDETIGMPFELRRTWWGRQCHRLVQAPSFSTRYSRPEYFKLISRRVHELICDSEVELLYVDGLEMVQYLPEKSDVPLIVDFCDCLSLLARRQAQMETSIYRKVLMHLESLSIERCERVVANLATVVTVISNNDADALRKIAPSMNIKVVPHGVDTEFFSPSGENVHRARLVFLGVMSYEPNKDAVIFFCKEILPLIRLEVPEVEFWIVGRDPSPRVRALADGKRVVVTGTVDDIRPCIRKSAVFVSPLRWGAGVKNKVLIAMAMKMPVVATRVSLDGIEVVGEQEVLVADRPEEFSAKVLGLLGDTTKAQALGERAYEFVRDRYSWEATGALFEDVVKSVSRGHF